MATTILLIRHAAHDRVHDTLVGRTPGVCLGEAGRAQAARLAERLAGSGLAAVYASPLRRARETAAPIAARLGLSALPAPDMAEIDFGEWTGRRFDALDADPLWRLWNRARGAARPPGGESMAEAQGRALGWIAAARERHADAAVAVVSHCDVIRAVLLQALGLPLDAIHRIEVSPASISRLAAWAGGARVLSLNEPAGEG